MTENAGHAPGAHDEPVPSWVANVRSRPRTRTAVTLAGVRRVYRLMTSAGVVLLLPTLTYAWLAPTTLATSLTRATLTLAVAFVVPVLVFRWRNPTRTAFMRSAVSDRDRSEAPHPALTWVPLHEIAPSMQLAVLVSEDPYFFWHLGFNPIEIARAYRYNRDERQSGRKLRGGSTITQQLAKNLFLSPAQSYLRKLLEAVFTALIEGLWTKRRILETYLNVVQFGADVFGIRAAAEHFFTCEPAALSDEEAALLTAALRAPRAYRVEAPSPTMRDLQARILQRMKWCGERMLEQLASP
jgi:monofunctional biosynthetic peptidoglycan transglycosylase